MLKTVSSVANAIGALNYKGTWDARTNSPALSSGAGTKGDYYVVSVAGTTTLDGISNWGVGDWVAFNGSSWQRVEGGADLNGVNISYTGSMTGGTGEINIGSGQIYKAANGDVVIGDSATAGFFDGKLNVSGRFHIRHDNGGNPVGFFWNQNTSADNGFAGFYTEGSATLRGSISYNRGAGLVSYNVTCDYRAKDILGQVVDSGAVIDSVPVYIGKMKGATQERPMFIAHETPSYAHTGKKDAVDENGNPVFQQLDVSALVPVLWAEVQQLRARVAQLESK